MDARMLETCAIEKEDRKYGKKQKPKKEKKNKRKEERKKKERPGLSDSLLSQTTDFSSIFSERTSSVLCRFSSVDPG